MGLSRRAENNVPKATPVQLLESVHLPEAVGVMHLTGMAQLRHVEGQWIATPPGPDLFDMPTLQFPWWLDTPESLLEGPLDIRDGELFTIRVEAAEEWSASTPDGSLGRVHELSRVGERGRDTSFSDPRHVAAVRWDETALDEAVMAALERMPRDWPVFEVVGARPEVSGWHTVVRTLQPVLGVQEWRGDVAGELLEVEPWLSPA